MSTAASYSDFFEAAPFLEKGKMITREGMPGVVFRQVPSEVGIDIIPKMTSLPEAVRQMLVNRGKPIRYHNQLAIISPDNHISSWAPSAADILAKNWVVFGNGPDQPTEGFAQARETVGTAKPLRPEYQQRVVDEKAELDARLDKLELFIETNPLFETLSGAEQNDLLGQRMHMREYSSVLGRRIKNFPA